MKTESLNAWNVAAIEKAVKDAVANGTLEPRSGKALIEKLNKARRVRLSYESA